MKKLMMIACMMFVSTAMFAQAGTVSVGANANYGMHSDYKNLGIGAKLQYEFIDNVRAEASFNYYLKKDNCSMWDVNVNGHYLIPIVEKLKVYPLAGITLLGTKVDFESEVNDYLEAYYAQLKAAYGDLWEQYKNAVGQAVDNAKGSDSSQNIGVNVGGGAEYYLTEKLKVNAEFKYQIVKDWNRPVFSAGIAYNF